ncbi:hypothetical protein [Flavisolibacter tropicus]|uniref:Uncharacterized protein n=1 Tax=Flavisolibacter tropicus TaxID=1492898 RepID=A0A172U142_9BACT|nr:hypothetical protein [Flavisolibacter tropicus]ANE52898.1 hypothetical protein SY85_22865 [Flavisolibacter tropicus]
MRIKTILLFWLSAAFLQTPANAQGLLKKVKDKVNQAVNAAGATPASTPSSTNSGNSNRNTGNTTGEGLVITPPDVNENLTSAETAFKSGNYSEARYSVQQAMLGVELQIGHQVLKSMPASISGLKADTTQDKVASVSWGWQGLTIQRTYGTDAKRLNIGIANNAVLLQAVNLYFTNGGYAESSNQQQNWKQTKVKGNRAVIEFDKSTGYKLSVPLGQTSLLVYEGINFATEQEMMTAANQLDIDQIKKLLGEK